MLSAVEKLECVLIIFLSKWEIFDNDDIALERKE